MGPLQLRQKRMARIAIPQTMLIMLMLINYEYGNKLFKITTAVCPDGVDFCEDPSNYPEQLISDWLDKRRNKREVTGHLQTHVIDDPPVDSGLGDPVCNMSRYWARPRAARNNAGRILFVLNMNGSETRQEYVQEDACLLGNLAGVEVSGRTWTLTA